MHIPSCPPSLEASANASLKLIFAVLCFILS